jgi:hypothetical protein
MDKTVLHPLIRSNFVQKLTELPYRHLSEGKGKKLGGSWEGDYIVKRVDELMHNDENYRIEFWLLG